MVDNIVYIYKKYYQPCDAEIETDRNTFFGGKILTVAYFDWPTSNIQNSLSLDLKRCIFNQ